MRELDLPGVLDDRFGKTILQHVSFRDEISIIVAVESIVEVLSYVRDELQFNHLSDVTSVDWLGREPRFDVVYHLYSYETHRWLRIKVQVNEGQSVDSCVGVFPGANWAEREAYDLMGITFKGHPSLTRIMLPETWVGHPLRKDYPMSQITLPRSGATKMPEARE